MCQKIFISPREHAADVIHFQKQILPLIEKQFKIRSRFNSMLHLQKKTHKKKMLKVKRHKLETNDILLRPIVVEHVLYVI